MIVQTLILLAGIYVLTGATIVLSALVGRDALVALAVGLVVAINVPLAKNLDLFGIAVPLGVIPFSFLYLIVNLVIESGDTRAGYRIAIMCAVAQVLFTLLLWFTLNFPIPENPATHEAIAILFDITPRVTLAGLAASVGGLLDAWIYDWLRKRTVGAARPDSSLSVWMVGMFVRSNVSSIAAQAANTAIFITVGFYGRVPNLLETIFMVWLVKATASIVGFPILLAGRLAARRSFAGVTL